MTSGAGPLVAAALRQFAAVGFEGASLQRTAPEALPRTRLVLTRDEGGVAEDPVTRGERQDRELFSGSAEAERRSRNFTGPVATTGA